MSGVRSSLSKEGISRNERGSNNGPPREDWSGERRSNNLNASRRKQRAEYKKTCPWIWLQADCVPQHAPMSRTKA